MFRCDCARISDPCGRMFLILGWNRHTAKDREEHGAGQWFDAAGRPVDFDYIREHIVASGDTLDELRESARTYKRQLTMTWSEFFREKGLPDSAVKMLEKLEKKPVLA